jgi:hypothetical protein
MVIAALRRHLAVEAVYDRHSVSLILIDYVRLPLGYRA